MMMTLMMIMMMIMIIKAVTQWRGHIKPTCSPHVSSRRHIEVEMMNLHKLWFSKSGHFKYHSYCFQAWREKAFGMDKSGLGVGTKMDDKHGSRCITIIHTISSLGHFSDMSIYYHFSGTKMEAQLWFYCPAQFWVEVIFCYVWSISMAWYWCAIYNLRNDWPNAATSASEQ